MARLSAAEKKIADRPPSEPVRVRALERGYYAPMEVIETRDVDGTKKREMGRNEMIRNEGEVFEYDAADMPLVSSLPKAKQKEIEDGNRETYKAQRGEVALPRWVTLASKREKETEPAGHTKTFGNAGRQPEHVI